MNVRVLPEAAYDMLAAADYYEAASPELGAHFLGAVELEIDRLAQAPYRWPLVDERHRRRVMARFPFSIYYRVAGEVVVVAVTHHRREPGFWRTP